MPPCSHPGCVAVAVAGRLCAVHRSGLGVPCPDCKGTGWFSRIRGVVCEPCGGSGLAEQHRRAAPPDRQAVDARPLLKASQ